MEYFAEDQISTKTFFAYTDPTEDRGPKAKPLAVANLINIRSMYPLKSSLHFGEVIS